MLQNASTHTSATQRTMLKSLLTQYEQCYIMLSKVLFQVCSSILHGYGILRPSMSRLERSTMVHRARARPLFQTQSLLCSQRRQFPAGFAEHVQGQITTKETQNSPTTVLKCDEHNNSESINKIWINQKHAEYDYASTFLSIIFISLFYYTGAILVKAKI